MNQSNEDIEFINNNLSDSISQNFEDHQGGRRPPTSESPHQIQIKQRTKQKPQVTFSEQVLANEGISKQSKSKNKVQKPKRRGSVKGPQSHDVDLNPKQQIKERKQPIYMNSSDILGANLQIQTYNTENVGVFPIDNSKPSLGKKNSKDASSRSNYMKNKADKPIEEEEFFQFNTAQERRAKKIEEQIKSIGGNPDIKNIQMRKQNLKTGIRRSITDRTLNQALSKISIEQAHKKNSEPNKPTRARKMSMMFIMNDSENSEDKKIKTKLSSSTNPIKPSQSGILKKTKIGENPKDSYSMNDIDMGEIPQFNQTGVKKAKTRRKMMWSQTFLIDHNSKAKETWDTFMTIVLLVTCLLTPYQIAFTGKSSSSNSEKVLNQITDILFGIDIVIIFNSEYYDGDMNLICDRISIAKNYCSGWFVIDVLAIVPFDLILEEATNSRTNSMARLAKIGRLYKLVKLTRLLRILKIMKEKSKLLQYINHFLNLGLSFERLFFFMLVFIILSHISTCLWVMVAQLQSENFDGTWVEAFIEEGVDNHQLYLTSLYWTIQTITTVGYGDIGTSTNMERIFTSIVMLMGVIAFSFMNGALSNIIANYDTSNAIYQEKLVMLNRIHRDYSLPENLYIRLIKSLQYVHQKSMMEINTFVDELPHKLKIEVSLYIYEERYKNIIFFQGKSPSFISWLCPLLQPQMFGDKQYIYLEGDEISTICFMISGNAQFVLPAFENVGYIDIKIGNVFGIIDIIGSAQSKDIDFKDWFQNKQLMQRQFTIMATSQVEVQFLSLKDLNRMEIEFYDYYQDLIANRLNFLRNCLTIKLSAINHCSMTQKKAVVDKLQKNQMKKDKRKLLLQQSPLQKQQNKSMSFGKSAEEESSSSLESSNSDQHHQDLEHGLSHNLDGSKESLEGSPDKALNQNLRRRSTCLVPHNLDYQIQVVTMDDLLVKQDSEKSSISSEISESSSDENQRSTVQKESPNSGKRLKEVQWLDSTKKENGQIVVDKTKLIQQNQKVINFDQQANNQQEVLNKLKTSLKKKLVKGKTTAFGPINYGDAENMERSKSSHKQENVESFSQQVENMKDDAMLKSGRFGRSIGQIGQHLATDATFEQHFSKNQKVDEKKFNIRPILASNVNDSFQEEMISQQKALQADIDQLQDKVMNIKKNQIIQENQQKQQREKIVQFQANMREQTQNLMIEIGRLQIQTNN